jgi:hypothetical protein
MLQVSRLVGESRFVFNSLCEPGSTLLCGNKARRSSHIFRCRNQNVARTVQAKILRFWTKAYLFYEGPRGLWSAHTSEADIAAGPPTVIVLVLER